MDEVEELFEMDLNRAAAGAESLIEECIGHDLPPHIEEVILGDGISARNSRCSQF